MDSNLPIQFLRCCRFFFDLCEGIILSSVTLDLQQLCGERSVRKYTFPDGEEFQACTRSTNLSQELGQARGRRVAEIQNVGADTPNDPNPGVRDVFWVSESPWMGYVTSSFPATNCRLATSFQTKQVGAAEDQWLLHHWSWDIVMVCQGGNAPQYLSVAILTFVSSLRTCSDNKCLQVNDGGRVKNQNIKSGWPEYHLQLKLTTETSFQALWRRMTWF